MELTFIKEFITLAEFSKFSAAARYLHISQSTLSRHIKTLENELGYPLFIRTTRDMTLSSYGEIFLPHAKKMCQEYQKSLTELKNAESRQNERIEIGIVHNPDRYHVIECIIDYQRSHPDTPIHVTEGSLNELYSDFQRGHLHMITTTYADWERIPNHFITAGKSRLTAVLPVSHPLASLETIPLTMLENVKLMVPEKISFAYRYLAHAFKEEHITPNIFYQGNTSGISILLQEDMGILIQDYELAIQQLTAQLVCRDLSPSVTYTYGLKYKENLTKPEQDFVRYIRHRFHPDIP